MAITLQEVPFLQRKDGQYYLIHRYHGFWSIAFWCNRGKDAHWEEISDHLTFYVNKDDEVYEIPNS